MLLTAFLLIIAIVILVLKRINDYWTEKGVYVVERTNSIVKVLKNLFINKPEPLFNIIQEIYQEIKNKNLRYGAAFGFTGRTFIPVDPELVKRIMKTDFEYFMGHNTYYNEKVDPLSAHLFNLDGAQWKRMRQQLTPTFTSGKMKMMFQAVLKCTEELKGMLDEYVEKQEPVPIVDSLARLTIDIIGNVAFGIECNSIKNPYNEFRQHAKGKPRGNLYLLKRFALPILPIKIIELFNIKLIDADFENFFMNVVKKNAEYREQNHIVRKDFFQMLLQLKNIGKVTDDGEISNVEGTDSENKLTIEQMAAECSLFFFAGFDSSATLMSFTLYELAVNPDIQKNLRDSINEVLAKHNGEISYEAINEMTYLQMVVSETMRKYPALSVIPRACTKDYTIPDTNVVIEKGTIVWIPAAGLHRDPEFYPDPLKFDPERFNRENLASLNGKCVYLPFGEGPRQCIGLRFGLLQTKVGLVTVLKNYRLSLNGGPVEISSNYSITKPKDEIYFDLSRV